MPDGSQPRGARSLTSRRLLIVTTIVVAVGLIVLAALIWYFFFRPAGPPPIGPGAPVIPDGASVGGTVVLALGLVTA